MNKEEVLKDLLLGLGVSLNEIPEMYDDKVSLWKRVVRERKPEKVEASVLELEDKFLRLDLINRMLTDADRINTIDLDFNIEGKHASKVALWQGDITSLYVDAVVNSANSDMLGTFLDEEDRVDYAIHNRSGMRLRLKCNDIIQGKKIDTSDILITRAYNLPCDFIIHVVAPELKGRLDNKEREALEKAYYNILECAKNNLIKTVAICAIGTGNGGYPVGEAAIIACKVVKEYLDKNEKFFNKIIFNVYSDEDYEAYKNIIMDEFK